MTENDYRENIKFLSSVLAALCLIVLVPMMGWGLNAFVEFADETNNRLAVLEFEARQGPRYTRADAREDFGPVIERINDHESRLRLVENKSHDHD